MSRRSPARVLAALLLAFSGPLHAQAADGLVELRRAQALLSVINSELRFDLDYVMVLQEAIKANSRPALKAQGLSPDAVSFDELAAAQRRAIEREASINARLDVILARSAALDAEKQRLLERVRALDSTPQATAAAPETTLK